MTIVAVLNRAIQRAIFYMIVTVAALTIWQTFGDLTPASDMDGRVIEVRMCHDLAKCL